MTKHDAFNAIGYGLGVVQLERVRQVDKHDWTPEHDDQYKDGELPIYARYWLTNPDDKQTRLALKQELQSRKSGGWEDRWFSYESRTPEERMARAGALACAEIDRLRRLAKS